MSSNDKSEVAVESVAETNEKASPDTKTDKGAKRPAEVSIHSVTFAPTSSSHPQHHSFHGRPTLIHDSDPSHSTTVLYSVVLSPIQLSAMWKGG